MAKPNAKSRPGDYVNCRIIRVVRGFTWIADYKIGMHDNHTSAYSRYPTIEDTIRDIDERFASVGAEYYNTVFSIRIEQKP